MDKTKDSKNKNKNINQATDEPQLALEITDSQMKEIESQQIEDDLTIKNLTREFSEVKRNLVFKKKKFESTKIRISDNSNRIDELTKAQKEIIKKARELNVYQNEIILADFMSKEKIYDEYKLRNETLSKEANLIFEKEKRVKKLKAELEDKNKRANDELRKQLKLKKEVFNSCVENLTQWKVKINDLQSQLIAIESSSNQRKLLITERNKRLAQLESEKEELLKLIKSDLENLIHQKNDKINDLNLKTQHNKEKSEIPEKLKLEIESFVTKISNLKEILEKTAAKKEEITKEVIKKKEAYEATKKTADENITSITDEINKIKTEIQKSQDGFSQKEEDIHKELNDLHKKYEEKKTLTKTMEAQQKDYPKVKEIRQLTQKELADIDKYSKLQLKKLNDSCDKVEQELSNTLKKQKDFDLKIKKLKEDISNFKEKELEQKANINDNTNRVSELTDNLKKKLNVEDKVLDRTEENPTNIVKSTPKTSTRDTKKLVVEEKVPERTEDNVIKSTPKPTTRDTKSYTTSYKKFKYNFDSSDDEDEEDEQDEAPTNTALNTSKKSVYDEMDEELLSINSTAKYSGLSESERLFEEMITQPPQTPKKKDDQDVFKKPQTYMTPMRKKSTYSRKN